MKDNKELIASLRRAVDRGDEFAVQVHCNVLMKRGYTDKQLEELAKQWEAEELESVQ